MTSPDNSTIQIILQGGSLSVLCLILVGLFFLAWKGGPRAAAFLTGLLDQLKALAVAQTELAGEVRAQMTAFMGEMRVIEERIKAHVANVGSVVATDVRTTVERTGDHHQMTLHQAIDTLVRQPSSPEMQAYRDDRLTPDRMTPTPSGQFTRVPALPPPPRSTRGSGEREREQDTPTSWRQVK
jgi:hypothetical protein